MPLVIPTSLWRAVQDHLQHCLPEEGCGMLAGHDGKADLVFPVTNVAHSPVRFRMHPAEQVRSLLAMEAMGFDLVAIYHSHPAGPAGPSTADVREAAYPEAAYLVARPGPGGWTARAFRIDAEQVEEIPWESRA